MHGEHTGERSTDPASVIDVDELPDGLVVTDGDGHVLTVNRAAARLTGVTREQAAGRHLRDVFSFHDHDGRDWWKWLDACGGLPTRARQPELPLRTLGGQEMLLAARLVREPRRGGEVVRVIITLRDTVLVPGWSAAAPTWSPRSPTSSVPR